MLCNFNLICLYIKTVVPIGAVKTQINIIVWLT